MGWDALLIQGGPWAIVSFCVLAVIRGWLIPRRTHLDRVGDLKAAIAALEDTVGEKDKQIGILLGRSREPAP